MINYSIIYQDKHEIQYKIATSKPAMIQVAPSKAILSFAILYIQNRLIEVQIVFNNRTREMVLLTLSCIYHYILVIKYENISNLINTPSKHFLKGFFSINNSSI